MGKYAIRLLIRHPNVDPAAITRRLGLEPLKAARAGESRVSPTGSVLDGVHPHSVWSVWRDVAADGFAEQAQAMIEPLVAAKPYVAELLGDGGTVELILDVSGQSGLADVLEPAFLAQLAELGVKFGLEIYPDWA